MMPFMGLSETTPTMVTRPKTVRIVYSCGPKMRAIFASGGAMARSAIALSVPPNRDAMVDIPNASPLRPATASGKPSSAVAIDASVPGVRNRIAVIEPP